MARGMVGSSLRLSQGPTGYARSPDGQPRREGEGANGRSSCLWLTLGELRLFGRTGEREGRGAAAADHGRDAVEVAGAHLRLMPRGGVAVVFHGELALLQPHVGAHALVGVAARELEHARIEG